MKERDRARKRMKEKKRARQRCSLREWEVEVKRKNERVNEREREREKEGEREKKKLFSKDEKTYELSLEENLSFIQNLSLSFLSHFLIPISLNHPLTVSLTRTLLSLSHSLSLSFSL